jgi:hypothetical protein
LPICRPAQRSKSPFATVVIGRLISATLLTLFVVPSLHARFSENEMPLENQKNAIHRGSIFQTIKEQPIEKRSELTGVDGA